MSQLEESVALLVTGIAVPLASFIAVAVGCGDSTAKKRSQKKTLSSKRQGSKSSKRSRSLKSRSKSKRRLSATSKKSASQSAAALKTAKQATSSQISKPAADSTKLYDSKRVSSKSKPSSRLSSKSKRSASKRRSSSSKRFSSSKRRGVRHARAHKRSSSSSKRRLSKPKFRSSSKSKRIDAATKKLAAADKSASFRLKSVKKALLSQNMAEKNYISFGVSKTDELSVYPDSLNFGIKGGQLVLTVANASLFKRFAIKTRCSDNQLYRLNPVYAFIEPKQTIPLTVYRHCGAAKVDKLMIVTTEVSKEELEPKNAFNDPNVIHPIMVVPLYVHGGNTADLDGLQRAPCTCAV